ncbi:hypothetical protein ERO13_A08G172125v2 [Gossypium hirsutum]|uniref:Ubiquitin-conjugating enzyme E2-23 kDa n=1 Tax=Gossypium hirsutum TaxID=3635 RepID=A0A1U8LX76_GOSHI|nr:ubiquitin-conjugating enzyme E2-23 kDa [Gossypium hirsutum]KAG4188558.1 hypothetical protein ERO13_A08G172125v2 [Gossypium hirsutum]
MKQHWNHHLLPQFTESSKRNQEISEWGNLGLRARSGGGSVDEYCEKYVKPKDIVEAEEVKSSDEKLSEDEYAASDDDEIAGK